MLKFHQLVGFIFQYFDFIFFHIYFDWLSRMIQTYKQLTLIAKSSIWIYYCIAGSKTQQHNFLLTTSGTRGKGRIIDIDAIKNSVKSRYLPEDATMNDFSDALVSLHSFTGCDTVSAFSRKRKVRALKLMSEDNHLSTFSNHWDVRLI